MISSTPRCFLLILLAPPRHPAGRPGPAAALPSLSGRALAILGPARPQRRRLWLPPAQRRGMRGRRRRVEVRAPVSRVHVFADDAGRGQVRDASRRTGNRPRHRARAAAGRQGSRAIEEPGDHAYVSGRARSAEAAAIVTDGAGETTASAFGMPWRQHLSGRAFRATFCTSCWMSGTVRWVPHSQIRPPGTPCSDKGPRRTRW